MPPPADDPATELAPPAVDVEPVIGDGDGVGITPVDGVPVATAAVETTARDGLKWWLIVAIIVVDQLTKAIVRATVALYDSITVVENLVDITHVRNAGVAFGLLNDLQTEFKWVITTSLGALALAGIAYYARHLHPSERIARLGLALILGGALGNLIDRLHAGYVLDFVDVYWHGWHFWAFNVADASITIGAVLVFVDLLLVKRHVSHSV